MYNSARCEGGKRRKWVSVRQPDNPISTMNTYNTALCNTNYVCIHTHELYLNDIKLFAKKSDFF